MTKTVATTPLLNNRVYDTLKWIAQIFLPALGTLYYSLGNLWNLPQVNKVVGTITVIDTFLGLLLAKSSHDYNNSEAKFDASLDVVKTAKKTDVSLDVEGGTEALETKDEMLVKVNTEEPPVKVTVAPKKRAPRKKT